MLLVVQSVHLHQHTHAARARKSANVVSANMVSVALTYLGHTVQIVFFTAFSGMVFSSFPHALNVSHDFTNFRCKWFRRFQSRVWTNLKLAGGPWRSQVRFDMFWFEIKTLESKYKNGRIRILCRILSAYHDHLTILPSIAVFSMSQCALLGF